jgi:hypothetical protein
MAQVLHPAHHWHPNANAFLVTLKLQQKLTSVRTMLSENLAESEYDPATR